MSAAPIAAADVTRHKWWGWGQDDVAFSVTNRPAFIDLARNEIGIDLAERPRLRSRELEGERRDDGAPELARCGEAPTGAPAEPSPDDGERQLVGKQLVIGEPLPSW